LGTELCHTLGTAVAFSSLLSLLKANKRLSPSDKNTVIKFLVDEMKKCCRNPDFSQSRSIARQVVAAYPVAFEDRTDDGKRLESENGDF